MEYSKSIVEVIKERTSSRTFDGRKIDEIALRKLSDYIAQINQENKIKGRFVLVRNSGANPEKPVKLGTYGFISGADSFLVGIIDKEEKDALTFGYLFEKIILCATDLGIQTCWLGGTFNKSDFEKTVNLRENEFIPIVSPIGYKRENPRIFETVMRFSIGADKRKAWNELFFEKNNSEPMNEKTIGAYALPLEMVRLGPSASNKQPWRIIHDGQAYHFFLCRTKGYGVMAYDLQKNDMGIAKCHFELSAGELGLKGRWEITGGTEAPDEWEYTATWIAEK
ncbi:nitroreductase family protein [Parasporobacterium paucivorans]|uniref:Nitroreductase family n=1 Tax=Parasporobacterium paucivorans DSM 15970 TaxID=1122934 RepID=A0A1M6IUI6_9FIRM|nr:nitroreductase family protein [Parasporobacterium paucivorans]SHJ38116.1 Nitroreductase family [Parasporobacterium paucivorans DSM 15970]